MYLSKFSMLADSDTKLRGESDLIPEGVLVRVKEVHDLNTVGDGKEVESEVGCRCDKKDHVHAHVHACMYITYADSEANMAKYRQKNLQ